MHWLVPLSLLIVLETVADVFAKEYSLKGTWVFWTLAILGYITANAFWLWAIRSGSGLARGAIIFSVASAVFAIIVGTIFYQEKVNMTQSIGMGLGVMALLLILWE